MNKFNLNSIELEILSFWKENNTFQKSIQKNSNKEKFVLYEGPPTANGKPGIHHVFTRTFKDIIGRFQTMNNKLVERIGGWDEHGLPVEIQVQKELSLKSKQDILDYQVDNFISACQTSTQTYIKDWEDLTSRMGYWTDLSKAYRTSSPSYIKKVWSVIQTAFNKGLIKQDFKVVPWSIDSGTTLSNAEVNQGYKTVTDSSLFVKFKSSIPNTYFLIWTTTPWTLPANMAIAFNPKVSYVLVKYNDQFLIVAESLNPSLEVIRSVSSDELNNITYYHPFSNQELNLYPANFVTDKSGTGLVHIAPAFGADDYELYKSSFSDQPLSVPINEQGVFTSGPEFLLNLCILNEDKNKLTFNKCNNIIKKYLKSIDLFFKEESYEHSYPFNWRTWNPLIYLARPSWYLLTSSIKDQLIANNQKVNWFPSHVKDGRFGNWLSNNVDWSISRERFWGTPLPIFLGNKGSILAETDIPHYHKPAIDQYSFVFLNETFVRIPEVLDCWFDSGAMPWAAYETYQQADVICEGMDQTRGWFYSLLVLGTILEKEAPFKNVLCTGLVLDKTSQKMSKSKGNVVDPWDIFNKHGADLVRWYMASVQMGNSLSFDEQEMKKSSFRFINQLWNTFVFFNTYYEKVKPSLSLNFNQPLDAWIYSLVNKTNKEVYQHYINYEFHLVTSKIEKLVETLSNVWVKVSRDRFWDPTSDKVDQSAFSILFYALNSICQMIAPIIPFLSEKIFKSLNPDLESIHLTEWKAGEYCDHNLLLEMDLALNYAVQAKSLRIGSKLKLRQPINSVTIPTQLKYFADYLKDDLNVKSILLGDKVEIDSNLTSELIEEGLVSEFVRSVQILRKDSGYSFQDTIRVKLSLDSSGFKDIFLKNEDYICKKLRISSWKNSENTTVNKIDLDCGSIYLELEIN